MTPPRSEKACEQHDHALPCPFCLNAQDDKERKRKADLFPQLVEALEDAIEQATKEDLDLEKLERVEQILRQAKSITGNDIKGEGND